MKLLILDGNSVINRAFYGVRPLTTREGLFTNAIFGFLNILQKMETLTSTGLHSGICSMRAIRPPGTKCRRNWPSRCLL